MPVTGDFAKLANLRQRIAAVGAAGFKQELANNMGAASMKLVADGFRGEHDPYGVPWAPLKYRKGRILRKTGAMAASVNAGPGPVYGSFRIGIPKKYARYHQYGAHVAPHSRLNRQLLRRDPRTGRLKRAKGASDLQLANRATFTKGITIPARPMLPTRERGLPPRWVEVFDREATKLLKRKLSQRGAR